MKKKSLGPDMLELHRIQKSLPTGKPERSMSSNLYTSSSSPSIQSLTTVKFTLSGLTDQVAAIDVSAGQSIRFSMGLTDDGGDSDFPMADQMAEQLLNQTSKCWRSWLECVTYEGRWRRWSITRSLPSNC